MSSSRARSRFAVVAAIVPLIAAGGALVSPASAATATVAPYHSIGSDNKVGPNAGFRNPAQGIRGNTAVLKIDVSSSNASLDRVELRLSGYPTGPAIVPDRDFAQGDGFAVYKDVPAPGEQPGEANFTQADFDQGAVSTGYTLGSPSGGQIPVRIAIDGVRATGAERYFITVHPGSGAGSTENRDFKLTVPVNGIRFGDTTLSPDTAVETPKLTIDSKPPVAPVSTSFTPKPQPPMERQTASPAKQDAYLVSGFEANDPDKTLLFLNDGNNVASTNFLYRADGTPAMAVPSTTPQTVEIGDGTGITATVKIARNNQLNDDVYVRAFDTLGNLSVAARLFDNSAATSGDNVDRANDVTAPAVSGTATSMRVRGVTLANQTAVNTRVTFTAPNAGTSSGTHSRAALAEARFVVVSGGVESTNPADSTPWANKVPGSTTSTSSQNVDMPVNAEGVGVTGSNLRVQARLLDTDGNATDIWRSTSLYPKDLIPPQLTGVSFEFDDDGDNAGDSGDKIRIRWSESMWKTSIKETNETSPCLPSAPEAPESCIIERMEFPDGGITWGTNPTVVWSADLTSVLVTLGQASGPNTRLPKQGDRVRSNSLVQDPAGNAAPVPDLSDRFVAAAPPIPVEGAVRTADIGGRNLYNQGRDGYLDRITATFPGTVTNMQESLSRFQIVGSEIKTPLSVTGSGATYTFAFDGVMGSGETPKLVYTQGTDPNTTLKVNAVPVPSFTSVSLDFAPPAVQMVTTADSDADGKLDRIVAKYSEALNHPLVGDAPGVYRVSGYETGPNGATSCPATGLPTINPYNSFGAGPTPDVVHINTCEKATPDTAVTPSVTGSAQTDVASHDDGPNKAPSGWSTGVNDNDATFNRVLDKAPPVAVSRSTRDLNSDGRIDAIEVVYGETLDGFSIENGRWIVTGRTITSVDILGSTGVRINIEPIAPGLIGDTDAKPTVQYTGGASETKGITDASDQRNSVRTDAAPVATSDGAGPAITGACAESAATTPPNKCPIAGTTDDKMNVFFSEAIGSSNPAAANEFAVEQPAGANKAATGIAMAADAKSATLTFANGTFDPSKDALVRFTGPNVVADAATPAQGNTQTASITAPAPPAVSLNLTCPTASSAGYCGASSINTGAVATAGLVRQWRLATTARTNTTPDSEYSSTVPSTYPPAGGVLPEGPLTLFLSGKDDFGRLSTEVSDSINILKAPTISTGSVQFVDTATRSVNAWSRTDTVMDGDSVRVGATAFSSDVKQWVSSTGGCLSQHMSVDYRGLTNGHVTHGAVAPFTCTLKESTVPDSRDMVFPFVKAVGTTKFPVGTVIKTTATDPGAVIVEAADGTQLRRHFISVNARRSHMVPDALVITVPASVMHGIRRGAGMGYRDGAVVKTSTSGYYYMYQNIKRPISGATLAAWKIPTSSVYVISPHELNAHGTGVGLRAGAHALGTWVKFPNGAIHQLTRNAQGAVVRRGVGSIAALRTLVPGNQIYPANSADYAAPFDPTFIKGYRDGTLLRTGTSTYAVVARQVVRHFANTKTLYSMGYNPANAIAVNTPSLPRHNGAAVTGAPIDRYKITSVVIKVTNKAGATATATVLPFHGGIFGVGTLDPRPANFDPSRT